MHVSNFISANKILIVFCLFLFIFSTGKSFSQEREREIVNIINKKNLNTRIEKIITDNEKLNLFSIKEYYLEEIISVDINFDKKNDLIVLLKQKYENRIKVSAKLAKTCRYRILLVLLQSSVGFYNLESFSSTPLNQYTEGLEGQSNFIEKNGLFYLKEYGRHISTDWCTEFCFEYNIQLKKLQAVKANIYSADLTHISPKIIKQISSKSLNYIPIDSLQYYSYFPFGFTDNIPPNK